MSEFENVMMKVYEQLPPKEQRTFLDLIEKVIECETTDE